MPKRTSVLPEIFVVNWFRKDENGKFIWPGYGQNMRVLKWIFGRLEGHAQGAQNALGLMPRYEDLDWSGLDFSPAQYAKATTVDNETWARELKSHKEFFLPFGEKLPKEFINMHETTHLHFVKASAPAENNASLS